MNDLAFLIVLSFFAATSGGGPHAEDKMIRCADMACVQRIEEAAHRSRALTRFQVFTRGRDGRLATSGKPVFPPIIDWQPL